MKKILKTWKASFQMLFSKNIAIMLFSASKTAKKTATLMLRHCTWLLLLDAVLHIYVVFKGVPITPTWLGFAFPHALFIGELGVVYDALRIGFILFSFLVVKNALAYTTCLAARPSLARKDTLYFWTYLFSKESTKLALGQVIIFILFVRFFYFFPLPWFCYFFLIDTHGTRWKKMIDAIKHGIVACFYFLPVALFLTGLERGIDMLFSFFLLSLQPVLPFYLLGLLRFIGSYSLWIMLLSLTVAFYVKIKHTYYNLFFSTVQK